MIHHGVDEAIWNNIINICRHYPEVSNIILYGSRARGDFKIGSDIDIAIDAPNLSPKRFALLWNELDDLPIIYSMDILHLQRITNTKLLHAIQTEGIILNKP